MSLLPLLLSPMVAGPRPLTGQAEGWLLATEDTRVRVAAGEVGPVMLSVGAVGDAYEWTSAPSAVSLPGAVEVDGQDVPLRWRFENVDEDRRLGALTLTYRCEAPPLTLRSVWRAREGRGPVEHWAELENGSDTAIVIPSLPSLELARLAPPANAELWWIRRGGANASTQGGVFTEPVGPGLALELVSDPNDGASPVPWAAVQSAGERGLYVGWEFSGIGGIRAEAVDGGTALALTVGTRASFRTDLAPGETFRVPAAFVGCYTGSIDEGAYSLHRFVLEKLRPAPPKGYADPTLAYNLYLDAGGASAREEDVVRCAHICDDLGFETFVPDAMWFPHPGDWRGTPPASRWGSGPSPTRSASSA